MQKLSVKGMAIGVGTAWALCNLFAGWTAVFGWGNAYVETMGSFYIGYQPTFVGGIIGGVWAFFDGAIFGLIIAAVYNRTAK